MKNLIRVILGILEAVIIGLIVKYVNFEVAILVLLIQIYVELFTGDINE